MSILTLPFLAILALQTATTPTRAPSKARAAVPAGNTREFAVQADCTSRMDTNPIGLGENEVMLFSFKSQCPQATMVLLEPSDPYRNPLVCPATAESPAAIGTKFQLRRGAPLSLSCTIATGTAKGVYKYRTKACTVTGADCSPGVIASPTAIELEIHVPDK